MWGKLLTLAIIGAVQTIGVIRGKNDKHKKVRLVTELAEKLANMLIPDITNIPRLPF